jgi:hypothetical protein
VEAKREREREREWGLEELGFEDEHEIDKKVCFD